MTPAEFRELVAVGTDDELLDACLRSEESPFVFGPSPEKWDLFRDELVTGLEISRSDIRIVGSARLGFSLKPGHNLKSFQETSDIDVLVVNAALFDRLWLALLAAAYPRAPVVNTLPGGWLRQRRNELYTGWLTPLHIRLDIRIFGNKAKPVLDLKTRWFNALKQASRHPRRRHEDVTGRLYRSWEHAELYHLHSLGQLRKTLVEEQL